MHDYIFYSMYWSIVEKESTTVGSLSNQAVSPPDHIL
jgi:hypothetical protein